MAALVAAGLGLAVTAGHLGSAKLPTFATFEVAPQLDGPPVTLPDRASEPAHDQATGAGTDTAGHRLAARRGRSPDVCRPGVVAGVGRLPTVAGVPGADTFPASTSSGTSSPPPASPGTPSVGGPSVGVPSVGFLVGLPVVGLPVVGLPVLRHRCAGFAPGPDGGLARGDVRGVDAGDR